MGVLRITVGEGSSLQTLAGRIQSRENPKGFKSRIAATGSKDDEASKTIDNMGEEGMDAENPADILARQEPNSRLHQLWRGRQTFSKLQPVARGQYSVESEELQSFNVKESSGQLSQHEGAVKVQDGSRPPTSPSVANEDPVRGPSGNQKDGSNNKGGGQNKNQGPGPSGSQNTNQGQNQNQGKGFDQAGPPRPSEKVDYEGPGQNGNQGNGPDQFGGPRPNQNTGGQNSGQNQGNNGSENQGQDQGKDGNPGKGDPSPKPKQNQNGNQNSDRTSETRTPKQTSTSDQTTSTVPTSSPAAQTTEPQAQPTDPIPLPQPSPSSAQTVQQPSQPPAITPSVQMSTASVPPSTATSTPSSTSSFSGETQVPTVVPPAPTVIGQPVAALEPTTSQVPESVVTQGSLQSAVPSNSLSSREIIGISVGGVSALVAIAALLVLFLKLRRRGVLPFKRKASFRKRDLTEDTEDEQRLSGAELGVSLVSQAAPVAGSLDDQEANPLATERDDNASRREVQRPRYVAYRPSQDMSRINDKGQDTPGRLDQEDDYRMSTASNPFSLQDELRTIVAPKARNPTSPVAQANLVQQPEPAESKDCPFQRLQGKLRMHNSSDPRPPKHFSRKPTAVDRGSVSTMSTSATDTSPHASARFSFGLLLQPSLDLFKFSDIRGSLGGRGSGWSLWFKQDDASNEKPSSHPDMGTK